MELKKIVLSIVVAILLLSCSHEEVLNYLNEGEGKITVNLPDNSRSWQNSDVSSLPVYYEILAFNSINQISSGVLTSGGSQSLTLPVGTYDLIVLAGNGSTTITNILGMDEVEDIVVNKTDTQSIDIELNTYIWNTTWPTDTTVLAGTQFDVQVELTFPVNCIAMSLGAGEFDIQNIGYGVNWTYDGTKYNGVSTVQAPSGVGSFNLEFDYIADSSLRLVDSKYNLDRSFSSLFHGPWWIRPGSFPSGHVSEADFKTTINTYAEMGRSFDVNIQWGADSL